MVLFDGVAGLFFLALWIFCIVDVITTSNEQVRNLPKMVWLLLVVLLVDLGSIAWLIAGRNWGGKPAAESTTAGPDARAVRGARPRPTNPDDDEEFLATLRARAEEQRRRAHDEDGPEGTAPRSS